MSMGNPLFQALGGIPAQNAGNNFSEFFKQFEQFRKSFTGDPRAEVQRLIDSGKMSQQQFNQLGQMATTLMQMAQGK